MPSLAASSKRELILLTLEATKRLERAMTELSQAVADIKTSVDNALSRVPALTEQLGAAQQAFSDLQAAEAVEDEAQQAAYDQAKADLEEALNQAQQLAEEQSQAAQELQEQADRIDTIGGSSETPAEETPAEEPVSETPPS